MISAERYAEAYRLFVLTLEEDRKNDLGYVFNGSFSHKPKWYSPFNWDLRIQPGVNIDIKKRQLNGEGINSLEFRFLEKPTNLNTLHQYLKLPTSQFRFDIKYSSDVRGPKPLRVGIYCKPSNKKVTELVLEPTDKEVKTISTELTIPTNDCDQQFMFLYNKNNSKNWQNRYSGSLYLYNVSIELIGG